MRATSMIVWVVLLGLTAAVGPSPRASAAVPSDESEAQFGIEADKYAVDTKRVRPHQTFSDVVEPYGVSQQQVLRLVRAVRSSFDVRQMKAGRPYRVYVNPWLEEARFLVYEIDATRYVLFDLKKPSQSRVDQQAVQRRWTVVRGTIESTLFETLTAENAHPELALRLSEVFAWQMDFFRIRNGDSFRILYERRIVNGEQVSPGKILAACINHRGEPYCGFRFNDGQGAQFFDQSGQSLRRSLLKAPLRFTRISSGYSRNRYHPILKRHRPHRGTDYAAPNGTPVHSVGAGRVVKAGYYGANGNYVKIRHNGTYTSGYLHLSVIADGVEPGANVEQGETIGYVGSTGRSTGPHLDYRLWKRDQAVDPYELELPPSRPVNPQYQEEFESLVEDRLGRLFPLRLFAGGASGWSTEPDGRG